MTQIIPQYAKSTNPDVVAVIERNTAGRLAMVEKARAWVREHAPESGGDCWFNGWAGDRRLVAVAGPKPTDGQWKKHGNGWAPYKTNPLHKEMLAIAFKPEPVPGVGESYAGEYNRDGSQTIYSPSFFVHEGAAYFRLPGAPVADQEHSPFGSPVFDRDLWTEILTSEWYAAHEAATGQAVRPL